MCAGKERYSDSCKSWLQLKQIQLFLPALNYIFRRYMFQRRRHIFIDRKFNILLWGFKRVAICFNRFIDLFFCTTLEFYLFFLNWRSLVGKIVIEHLYNSTICLLISTNHFTFFECYFQSLVVNPFFVVRLDQFNTCITLRSNLITVDGRAYLQIEAMVFMLYITCFN